MKRKILYISGSRADYGLMRSVLRSIHHHPSLSLDIIVTGMHLMEEFGNTIDEIKNDGFRYHIVDVQYKNDVKESMATFIGQFLQELVPVINHLHPDIILVLGDRGEMLAGAIAGVYLSTAVAHIHGGEVTSTVDDYARHAITKLSHIHFPATQESADRIIKMGEDPTKVFVVGAPGVDQIINEILKEKASALEKFNIVPSKPLLLVIQHPVTLEVNEAPAQIRETLDAITELQLQTIIVYPNADAGGRAMIEIIKNYESLPYIQTFKNISHADFLELLKITSLLIGNSSSGIIEAPSFGVPVVNIGSRQSGRQRGQNILDVEPVKNDIIEAIKKSLYDEDFRVKVKECENPYGDGKSGEKIVKILNDISIDKMLLQKRMTY